jgi:hypothetical protein
MQDHRPAIFLKLSQFLNRQLFCQSLHLNNLVVWETKDKTITTINQILIF